MKANGSAIVFDQVNKFFYLQHQKTLKELVQALFYKEKTIERIHALKGVSFSVKKGETVGIIGPNGAGKSTILKLIAGVSGPTSGQVKVSGRITPLIELGAGFHPELTGRENIFLNGVILGLTERYIRSKLEEIVAFSEINPEFIDMPVKHYSSGMYLRLAFSVAVFTQPDILLVDEILAVGDTAFQKKCLDKMAQFQKEGVTIVYISHSMDQVRQFCHRVIYLNKGEIKYDGKPEKAIDYYLNDIKHHS